MAFRNADQKAYIKIANFGHNPTCRFEFPGLEGSSCDRDRLDVESPIVGNSLLPQAVNKSVSWHRPRDNFMDVKFNYEFSSCKSLISTIHQL